MLPYLREGIVEAVVHSIRQHVQDKLALDYDFVRLVVNVDVSCEAGDVSVSIQSTAAPQS